MGIAVIIFLILTFVLMSIAVFVENSNIIIRFTDLCSNNGYINHNWQFYRICEYTTNRRHTYWGCYSS